MTKSKSHRTPILHITYPTGVKEIAQDLPKDELVRRMKMLARSFQDMEQEEDNSQYEPLAIHITESYFLKHSSKDVRLLVACCVADVFRIFAPEAPYRTPAQLKTIFKFLCEQLWDLETTTSPLWKRYFYLLENLAMVKSFNICMELADSNDIFIRLFTIFFSIVNKNHPPKVKGFMLDVMCPLISENDSVSPDLLEVILKYLVESKCVENPHANQLAKELIKRTSTSIEPAMQTYFNNALVLGKSSDSELSSHTYELIYQLNLISNNLLLAVLPQLEFKLKTNEEKERLAVSKLLGRMFSEKDSELASNNKPLWNCFLGRFSDISCVIRIQCVKFVPDMLANHPYLLEDLADRLRERVHDVEDDVRIEAVQALVSAAKKDISAMSPEMLELVKERTLDKKWRIRKESILGLAHIYKKWCHSEEAAEKDKERLLWIKDKILHSYYLPELDDKLLVERIFTMNLVPYTLLVPERMQRFLELFVTVDDHSVKAIIELTKCQHIVRTHLRDLLEGLKKETDEEQQKTVFSKVVAISKCLPESNKTQEPLKKMVKALQEDKRLLSYMTLVVSPDVTCKKAAHAVGEVMKKFSSSKTGATTVYTTVKTMMERVAPLLQDTEATTEFLKIVSGYIEGTGEEIKGVTNKEIIQKALKLLQMLAHVYPYTFKSEESFNCLAAMAQNEEVSGVSDTALQMLTQVAASFEDHFPEAAKGLQKTLTNYATSGSQQQAKHSIRCINGIYTSSKKEILETVFKISQKNLSLDHEHFLTALTTVAHIAHLAPEQFLGPMKTIIAGTIVKGILMQDRSDGSNAKGIWCLDDQLCDETQGKLLAIKVLVHWLLGLGKNINGSVISTIRLLTTMLKNEGDLMERKKTGRADMSRLRLTAGCAFLKLAQEPAFTEFISLEQFQLIALLINDECFQVRQRFAEKLNQGLISLRLPLSYMSILSLSVKDPVKDSHKKAIGYIQQCITVRRQYLKQHHLTGLSMTAILPEYVIPHTVHLLSHDPDFVTPKDFEALNDIKECLWFMLEPLVNKPESVSFIRKILQTIKQMKDAQAAEDKQTANKKLYAVCEVGLGLLTTKLPTVVTKEHPGDVVLPGRLFIRPKKPVNPRDSYLPKKLQQEFSQVAEAKTEKGEGKDDKGKKKPVKGATGKKKSGDENQSPLGKKENKDGKTNDKKTAKSRKVLTQKEENNSNRSKRSLRGKGGSTPKRITSPSKEALSSSPEVQSPKPKTKQSNLNKFVTSTRKSGSSTPVSQKSPSKNLSSASSSPSPAKRRKEAAASKSNKDETKNAEKETKKVRVKALLNVKDKGDKKMVKTSKVATIKRTVKAVSRTGAAKRRASSPLKSSPEKRIKGSPSKTSPQKTLATVAKSPTKASPVKSSSQRKKTPVSTRGGKNQQNQKAAQAKKRTPTMSPSPKKSTKRKPSPSPPVRSKRASRKPSPSPSSTKSKRGKPSSKKPAVSPTKTPTKSLPIKKPAASTTKTTPISPKKLASPAAKKHTITRKTGRPSARSASPLTTEKASPLQMRSRELAKIATRASNKTSDKTPPSTSKSPNLVTKRSQRVRKPTPAMVGFLSQISPAKTPVSPAKSPKSPPKSTESFKSSKRSAESPEKNTRLGRSKASTFTSRTSEFSSSRKASPMTRGDNLSRQKSASSSPAKSPKSPPKVRRVSGKLVALTKPSPVKKLTPLVKKAKSPTTKKGVAKTRSSGKSPSRETVKRKLMDSESESASSPARSSRTSVSSAKSSPRKSPSPVKSRASSPVKSPSPSKKKIRQTSNLRNTSKGNKSPANSISKSGKDSATKRKASSQTLSIAKKKRKINSSPAKSPKMTKKSSPAKSSTRSKSSSPAIALTRSRTSSPAKSLKKSTTSSPAKSPTRSKTSSPAKSMNKSKTSSPAKSLNKSKTSSPAKSLNKSKNSSPAKSMNKSKTSSPAKSLNKSKNSSPAKSLKRSKISSPTKSLNRGKNSSPAKSPNRSKNTSPAKSPNRGKNTGAAKSPNRGKNSSPAKSALNISRRSHRRKR